MARPCRQLHDVSLFDGDGKFAQGWGFEIMEDRNWMMFVCANLVSLLMSGALVGLSAKDNATGVAIWTWLTGTAMQTLVITALFWHRMN
jgi:hypothetical protein